MAGLTLQFFIQHYLVLNSIRFLDQSYFSDVYITNNLNKKNKYKCNSSFWFKNIFINIYGISVNSL